MYASNQLKIIQECYNIFVKYIIKSFFSSTIYYVKYVNHSYKIVFLIYEI